MNLGENLMGMIETMSNESENNSGGSQPEVQANNVDNNTSEEVQPETNSQEAETNPNNTPESNAVDQTEETQETETKTSDNSNDQVNQNQDTVDAVDNAGTDNTNLELTDEAVLDYLKSKGKSELNSIDDLFKEPEQAADPLEGLSDEAIQFIKYTKETGRGFKDFQELNRDFSKMNHIDIAKQKAIEFSDGDFTESEAIEFLERELNIDLSDDLDKIDAAKLKNYGKDWIQNKISEQEKYKQPIERNNQGPELVTLEDGSVMEKSAYEKAMNSQIQYQEGIKSSTDKITSASFKVKIDDNGTEKEIDLSYDYSKDDKHRMVSNALDVNKFVQEISGSENGLNYAAHQENLQWYDPKFREKAFASIAHKLLAQQAEEFMAKRTNANFDNNKSIPSNGSDGKKIVIPSKNNGFGVKYNFDNV